jgi:Xaa-Pro aminopeptidase
LHYRFNDDVLRDGQLLLIDCGAEYQYYAGDITRTYPVNGKFTAAQRRVYDKILKVQLAAIEMVKPGLPHYELQRFTIERLTQILVEEGLLKGSVDENIRAGNYVRYYPHGVSHLLGLDVHDAGRMLIDGQSRPLEEGFVITVEPGLYFPADDANVPAELKGVGIRIEDDVLVTATGNEVFTRDVPKEAEAMEALIGRA